MNSCSRKPNLGTQVASRAQGCFLGQLAGDALGSLVEFQTPEQIRQAYPNGVQELVDGGTWNTIAGQPTDDSEMALLLPGCWWTRENTTRRKPGKLTSTGLIPALLTAA